MEIEDGGSTCAAEVLGCFFTDLIGDQRVLALQEFEIILTDDRNRCKDGTRCLFAKTTVAVCNGLNWAMNDVFDTVAKTRTRYSFRHVRSLHR